MFNPSFFLEIASHNSFSIFMGLANFHWSLELMGLDFKPFDFQYFVSLETSDTQGAIDQCFGIQLINDVVYIEFSMSVDVLECNLGLFGLIIGDPFDCYWTTYDLAPFFDLHFIDEFDTSYEIFPWSCNFDTEQVLEEKEIKETNNRGYSQEYFATEYEE